MVKVIIPEVNHQRKHGIFQEDFTNPAVPNAPPLSEGPPGYDLQCDVFIEVGSGENIKTFSAKRSLIQEKCPVLAHLVADQSYVVLRTIDPQAFEQLLRYLNKQSVTLTTVPCTLGVLEAGRRFMVMGLLKQCVNCLDLILNKNNVIAIYKYLHPFCRATVRGFEPSAPPLEEDMNDSRLLQLFGALYENCLVIIDQNAYSILMGNELETFSSEELFDILSRDTFYLKSEILILEAIMRWSDFHCRESNMEITSKARKYILGDLKYAVRYGLLSKDDFYKRVEMARILESTEVDQIRAYHKNKQISLPHKMAKPRRKTIVKKLRRVCSSTNVASQREQLDNISTKSEGRYSFAQKCLINCLTIWTALFD